MIRIALVTNLPPPYRVPVFNLLGRHPKVDFHAIFCAAREPNRSWDLPAFEFNQHHLKECFLSWRGRYIHHNIDVLSTLNRLQPDVVITDGFNPTHLYAFMAARQRGWQHVAMTDGTLKSERSLSAMHRVLRRWVLHNSAAFIAASSGGTRLFESYGVPGERCFYSWLCADNAAFLPSETLERSLDFIFCGRFEPDKAPLFALAVARATAKRLGRKLSISFAGSGSLDQILTQAASSAADEIEVKLQGFLQQHQLPNFYRSGRVFLFPTRADVWGVVANEACAAGLPVIVSPHAGVAGELIVNGRNGFVRELQLEAWADCATRLLTDSDCWQACSRASLEQVSRYTYQSAAQGLVDACLFACQPQTTGAQTSLGHST